MGFRFVRGAYRRLAGSSPLKVKPSPMIESVSSYSIPPSQKWALWRTFSRFLLFGSLSTVAGIAYVSYGELAKKIQEKSAQQDGDPIILGYNRPFISFASFTMSLADKAINNYMFLRFVIEEILKDLLPSSDKLLPDKDPKLHNSRLFTLVLDFNETLVHSDWKDELKGDAESCKRPGFDAFLQRLYDMGCYELVLYTDEISLAVTVFRLINLNNGDYRSYILTSGSNKHQDGKDYRDLSKLNRDPSRIIYVSGHALENCLQPENCVPIKPWKKEVGDTTLTDLLHFLKYVAYAKPDDIRPVLSLFKGKDIAKEFSDRGSKLDEIRRLRNETRLQNVGSSLCFRNSNSYLRPSPSYGIGKLLGIINSKHGESG